MEFYNFRNSEIAAKEILKLKTIYTSRPTKICDFAILEIPQLLQNKY